MKKTNRFVLLVLLYLLVVGCNRDDTKKAVAEEDKIAVPVFIINISLTKNASKRLKKTGEFIKGAIVFDGDGVALPGVKTAPRRDVVLGEYVFKMEKAGQIKIDNAFITKEAYSRLEDENYYFTINIFSARRIFETNILDCMVVLGRYQDLKSGKVINSTCDLLYKNKENQIPFYHLINTIKQKYPIDSSIKNSTLQSIVLD